MILVVAAMEEELKTCMELCRDLRRMPGLDIPMRQAVTASGIPVAFLRAGVGPEKSTARIRKAFDRISPERMLVTGYAGALDPKLKIGDLVAVTLTRAFRMSKEHPDWEHIEADESFAAAHVNELTTAGTAAGLSIFSGGILSSPYVLGNPEHKKLLFRRFHASAVDMETAFLVREAAARQIPASVLRAISDTAQDSFLEPFERDPDLKLTDRALKLFQRSSVSSLREWKNRSASARGALTRFWEMYLKSVQINDHLT